MIWLLLCLKTREKPTWDPQKWLFYPSNLCIQPMLTHVCIVLSNLLDVLYASCFCVCLKQEKQCFSLLYDIDLLLAMIVLYQSGVNVDWTSLCDMKGSCECAPCTAWTQITFIHSFSLWRNYLVREVGK